jgi:hypothetical protein
VFVGVLVAIWLLFQLVGLVTNVEEQRELLGLGIGFAVASVLEKRAEHRARLLATALTKIEQAVTAVRSAGSKADRARALTMLAETLSRAGRIGTPAPLLELPNESAAAIDSTIGAIQAEAEYQRGKAEQRERRMKVLTYVFGAIAILSLVAGVIPLV